MLDLLADSPLLLLFVVAAIGVLVGRIRVGGFSLGISAVLFVGIAASALDERLVLPEFVVLFGLALFVYLVGVASGPGFARALRRRGLADNGLAAGVVVLGAVLVAVAAALLDLPGPLAAGLFAGSLTNTPALAAVVESLRQGGSQDASLPVVAYTLCYPIGVIGMLGVLQVQRRRRGPEEEQAAKERVASRSLTDRTVRITRVDGVTVGEILRGHDWDVRAARHVRGGVVEAATDETELRRDDLLSLVGPLAEVERAVARLGVVTDDHLELDRSRLDFRRVFVSNPDVAGRTVGELRLARHGATMTRIRRGDVDLVARQDSVLQIGDRVRIVARREDLAEVSELLGDSYRSLGEVDVMTLGLGIAAGLLLGSIPVPLPGDAVLRLGFAAGPLVAGLVLGARGRTGPLLWQIPYGANLTLRQLGILLFLAGVGTRSGTAFASEVADPRSLGIVLTGAVVTMVVGITTVTVGRRVLGVESDTLAGMLAGIQTQPAVLAYALDQAEDESPNTGYAAVFPIAMITKIVLAQVLVVALA